MLSRLEAAHGGAFQASEFYHKRRGNPDDALRPHLIREVENLFDRRLQSYFAVVIRGLLSRWDVIRSEAQKKRLAERAVRDPAWLEGLCEARDAEQCERLLEEE